MAFHTRNLLRTLSSVGVTDLDSLKQKLDEYGARKPAPKKHCMSQKVPLDSQDVIAFLEGIGLWYQADVLRKHDKKQLLLSLCKDGDIQQNLSDSKPHRLCRDLQALYFAPSATAIATSLTCETADEERLQTLARRSQELCPALGQMRDKAVDRAVLADLVEAEAASEDDGQSSGGELGLSCDSSGDEEDVGKKKQSLMLTAGWRVERTKMSDGRERRVFIDPLNQRFEREADARQVIELKESAKRMVAKMQERLTDGVPEGPSNAKEPPKKKRLYCKTMILENLSQKGLDAIDKQFVSPGKRKSILGLTSPGPNQIKKSPGPKI